MLLHPTARACCAALLSALPPNAQWVRAALDQLAMALSQLAAQAAAGESASEPPLAQDAADSHSVATRSVAHSVRLLVETPLPLDEPPVEGGAAEGGGEAQVPHQQYWLARYGALPQCEAPPEQGSDGASEGANAAVSV